MKDVLTDTIEDINEGVKIYLRDAYHRGYKHGEQSQNLINQKLSNPKLILGDFIKFIKNYKMTMLEGEIRFSNNNYVYMDENIINLFLLKYDYDAE
jgi:hypothetical protein